MGEIGETPLRTLNEEIEQIKSLQEPIQTLQEPIKTGQDEEKEEEIPDKEKLEKLLQEQCNDLFGKVEVLSKGETIRMTLIKGSEYMKGTQIQSSLSQANQMVDHLSTLCRKAYEDYLEASKIRIKYEKKNGKKIKKTPENPWNDECEDLRKREADRKMVHGELAERLRQAWRDQRKAKEDLADFCKELVKEKK